MVALCGGLWAADLSQVMAEPNLERRSRAALVQAEQSIKTAGHAYGANDLSAVRAALEEVAQAVELAHRSLRETGKNPSRSPKHFKHAEIKSRELLKRLEALALEMDAADRPMVEPIKERVTRVHDEILTGIMSKKKRKK